jgi:hypothetical protein
LAGFGLMFVFLFGLALFMCLITIFCSPIKNTSTEQQPSRPDKIQREQTSDDRNAERAESTGTQPQRPQTVSEPKQQIDLNDPSDSDIGRTGIFTTNQHSRSGPGLSYPSVAMHFQNARFNIIGQRSHQTPTGISKWYRVKVIEYGCDAEQFQGCGKSAPSDLDDGWLNGNYVHFDQPEQ